MNRAVSSMERLKQISATAPFNMWAGFEITNASDDEVEIRMPWRPELTQYSGFLHAGVVGALVDTACGFAAVLVVGNVMASHCSVNFLSPAIGRAFLARGRVIKAGKRQVFTRSEIFAETEAQLKLVATGETILTVQRN